MIPLLSSPRERGYPDDFLIARIKGRGAAMREQTGPEPAMENEWVYERMQPGKRDAMALFFAHAELWRIFICLRYAVKGKSVPGMAGLMRGSVLSPEFRDALSAPIECSDAVLMLSESMLEPFCARSIEPALCGRISTEGLMSLEREVCVRLIAAGARSKTEGLRAYFMYMADRYNLLGLIKSIRLGIARRPVLAEGGRFSVNMLSRVFEERRGDILASLAERLTGERLAGSAAAIHNCFTRGLLRRMSRVERSHPSEGAVIAHLVRAQVLVAERRMAELASEHRELAA